MQKLLTGKEPLVSERVNRLLDENWIVVPETMKFVVIQNGALFERFIAVVLEKK